MPWVKGQSGNPSGTNQWADTLICEPPILTEWTAVAIMRKPPPTSPHLAWPGGERGNPGQRGPRWRQIEDAPISYRQARALVEAGMLLAANRVTDEGTEYVVKSTRLAMQQCREVA